MIDFGGLVPDLVELDLLAAINAFRAKYNLKPLANDPRLTAAAQKFSDGMALTGILRHDSNALIVGRVKNAGFAGRWSGEIIAMGEVGYAADDAVRMWINSPPHRSIMMGAHNVMGGSVTKSLNASWWCVDFGVI